jgi:hypothetical protein
MGESRDPYAAAFRSQMSDNFRATQAVVIMVPALSRDDENSYPPNPVPP